MAQRSDSGEGNSVREGPHTIPTVGIEADVRPIGEDGVDRMREAEIQSRRAYGEAGTSVRRERVCSKSPSHHAEDGGPGKGS